MRTTIYVDLDGTIIDVMPRYYKILKNYYYMTFESKFNLSFEIFKELKRNNYREHDMVKKYCNEELDIDDYVSFKRHNLEKSNYLLEDKIIVDLKDAHLKLKKADFLIKLLSQRYNIETSKEQIHRLGIDEFFDEIIIVNPTNDNAKKQYLLNANVNKKDIIIGDSPLEMECASHFNIQGCFVETGLYSKTVIDQKHSVFKNYNDAVNKIVSFECIHAGEKL